MATANISRRGFFGHCAGAYTAIGAIGGAAVVVGSLDDLYARWLRIREGDDYASYVALQAQIVEMEAVTARDLAIQFIVETDYGGSDVTDRFKAGIFALALG